MAKKQKSYFKNDFDAAKKINKLCVKMEILPQNPEIGEPQNQQDLAMKYTSKYKGVHRHVKSGKWHATLHLKGHTQQYGGIFNDELDAAKRVNQLCEALEISPQNPGISSMPNEQLQAKEKKSQYKGVFYRKKIRKWYAKLQGRNSKYGGVFDVEMDAAQRVNELCEEFGIPLKNPGISGIPNQSYQPKEKTSQYKGVCWHKQSHKWYARLHLKGQPEKYGGIFDDEMDAAKRVNQFCEEFGIPVKNPGISGIPNQSYQECNKKTIDSESVNPIIDSEITKPTGDNSGKNENKRKRKKELVEQYYFYADDLLK